MRIHFIGIGGASMSALAKYLVFKGYDVSGSDGRESKVTCELKKLGIAVTIGHSKKNVIGADVVVYSSAISDGNEELSYASSQKYACISRAELLKMISSKFCASVGVSGCHGKTTVTSLLAHILNVAKMPFTAHIGGFDNKLGNLIVKGDTLFLSEVCEFKRNIDKFTATTAVCLNIDNDHMNCYRNINELKQTFFAFLDRAQYRIINADDKELTDYKKPSVTFGEYKGDFTFKNYTVEHGFVSFDVFLKNDKLFDVKTDYIGKYYALNVVSATATAITLGINIDDIKKGISAFQGVKRRNEIIGKINGIVVVSDYAHHPTEIENFLSTYKDKNVLCVFQPHTYSRTKILFDDFLKVFSDVKNLFIYKTYSARETYDYSGSAERLADALYGAKYFDDFRLLFNEVTRFALNSKGDGHILIIGAGDLYDEFLNEFKKENP